MKEIKMVFASSNAGKIAEMKYLINKNPGGFDVELLGLKDIGFTDNINEIGTTFEENAEIKARAVFDKTGLICFADDSGLCVDYLNGAPGIYSARYGGESARSGGGKARLLEEMKDVPDGKRAAHFYCAIYCIVSKSESFCVSGKCGGIITRKLIGESGFGYDPVFYYPPANKTFAQMTDEEKNKVSHRAAAAEQFVRKITEIIIRG